VTGVPVADAVASGQFTAEFARLRDNICTVVRGKREAVELALVCLFAEGHLLIEDVPGVGKTTIARALAASLDGRCTRIQFTPDLLPSDVTGVSIFDQRSREFAFHPGPVFANIVLGDEINRASPKTQSALLEVMQEQRVTVDGLAHPVPRPFIVIGTQNPIDMDGTYPLPEAQLDRFLMRISVGYPSLDAEVEVLAGRQQSRQVEDLRPVLRLDDVALLIQAAEQVYVASAVSGYLVRIVAATRQAPSVRLGASPRGSLALARAAKVRAAADGRGYVTPEDVKALAPHVLAHRVLVTSEARVKGVTPESVVAAAVASVPVPHEQARA
jgi:MoxR-like ATPase